MIGAARGRAQRRRLRPCREGDWATDASEPANTGQFVIALDVARFLPAETFRAEIDRHVRDFTGRSRLPGFDAHPPSRRRNAAAAGRTAPQNGVA